MPEVQRSGLGGSLRRFKPYPAYKDSGVEWLREVPSSWAVKRWRYCCRVTEGQVPPEDDRYRERILIAPNHIESGTGRILFFETANEQGAISGKYLVDPGDLIYSKIRPALNKACIAEGKWLCSADMYPIKIISQDLTARFLLYFVLSQPFARLMVDESMRVAMPKVNRETLTRCPVVLPTSEEQDAIAAFLDRETMRIDALVAKKERLIELLQEKRTALITRAVTKGLDPNVPMKDSGVEWLGEIPAHWKVWPLKTVSGLQTGMTLGKKFEGVTLVSRPYLRVANVQDGYLALDDITMIELPREDASRYELRKGDVLLTEGGDFDKLGRGCVWDGQVNGCLHQNHIFAVRPRSSLLRSHFLASTMSSGYGRAYFTATSKQSTNLASTNSTKLGNLPLPLPDVSEQDSILEFLARSTARLDTLVAKVREAIDRLKELRAALISAAATGKIDVREEDA
jgi:type I restriction enzyme S subunit